MANQDRNLSHDSIQRFVRSFQDGREFEWLVGDAFKNRLKKCIEEYELKNIYINASLFSNKKVKVQDIDMNLYNNIAQLKTKVLTPLNQNLSKENKIIESINTFYEKIGNFKGIEFGNIFLIYDKNNFEASREIRLEFKDKTYTFMTPAFIIIEVTLLSEKDTLLDKTVQLMRQCTYLIDFFALCNGWFANSVDIQRSITAKTLNLYGFVVSNGKFEDHKPSYLNGGLNFQIKEYFETYDFINLMVDRKCYIDIDNDSTFLFTEFEDSGFGEYQHIDNIFSARIVSQSIDKIVVELQYVIKNLTETKNTVEKLEESVKELKASKKTFEEWQKKQEEWQKKQEEGQKKQEERMENLEEGNKKLEEGQKKQEERMKNLEEGQKKMEFDVKKQIEDNHQQLRSEMNSQFQSVVNILNGITARLPAQQVQDN